MTNKEIEIYYKDHPNSTLKEFLDYVKEQDRIKFDLESENYYKKMDWYKNLEGRYFMINFNSNLFLVLYVDHWPNSEFRNKYLCYNISISDSYITKQDERNVNRYWFHNPYETLNYGQNDCCNCKEITKEEFDSIIEKSSQIKEIVESINIK